MPLSKITLKGEKADIVTALSSASGLSKSEVRRKVMEGALEVNGKKVKDPGFKLEPGKEYKVRVGKKFYRLEGA